MNAYYRHPVGRPYEPLCEYCADTEWNDCGPIVISPVEPDYIYSCGECLGNALIDGQCHEEFHAPRADGTCEQCGTVTL
jgi:hypothetical protein